MNIIRNALIGGGIALLLNGCAATPPPPAPTAAQLAPWQSPLLLRLHASPAR